MKIKTRTKDSSEWNEMESNEIQEGDINNICENKVDGKVIF